MEYFIFSITDIPIIAHALSLFFLFQLTFINPFYSRQLTDLGDNSSLNSPDSETLRENRLNHVNTPLRDHLNINSLRNKTVDLREIILDSSIDYLVLSEIKIDGRFPTA